MPGASASLEAFGTTAVTYGPSDVPDPMWFAILIAIMVAGFLLLALATWYTARRSKR